MSDPPQKKMTTEEAIMEIRALQIKHDQEIKEIQGQMVTTSEETKLITAQTKQIVEDSAMTFAYMRKEMSDLKLAFLGTRTTGQHDEQSQSDNNQNGTSFSLPSQQADQNRNISSPITTSDNSSIHNNLPESNYNKTQTIFTPSTTNAPVFHGNPSERPGQFLNRIKEYTKTAHMWGEDTLLRRISYYLQDEALDWYCQLNNYHDMPTSWSEFKQVFIEHFNPPILKTQQQWNECVQNKEETIKQFMVRLRVLWEEQFPQETEADLVDHLLCKMRPATLNLIGYPENASLQQILLQAQRAEEFLCRQTRQGNRLNNSTNNTTYNNNNNYVNKNTSASNKTNEYNQSFNNSKNNMSYQRTQNNPVDEQKFSCYICGRYNHRARDCWYKNGHTSNYPQQSTSQSKN